MSKRRDEVNKILDELIEGLAEAGAGTRKLGDRVKKLHKELKGNPLIALQDPDRYREMLAEMEDLDSTHKGYGIKTKRLLERYDRLKDEYPEFYFPDIPDEYR